MNPLSPLSAPLSAVPSFVVDRVRTWSVASQHGACRNAMVATTALAERRAERLDVDAYLATLRTGRSPSDLPTAVPR
jgi:hypothetical protein